MTPQKTHPKQKNKTKQNRKQRKKPPTNKQNKTKQQQQQNPQWVILRQRVPMFTYNKFNRVRLAKYLRF